MDLRLHRAWARADARSLDAPPVEDALFVYFACWCTRSIFTFTYSSKIVPISVFSF